ncbi:electron transport complex subunit RsxC [Halomonas sp. RT37]|uniref:Ion-translocating oxidoreductase complex subunit C n=1 Tax=Halomonas sp. RT37 TaxID=2950872 RepID=A0AAU7KC58_9GAMM
MAVLERLWRSLAAGTRPAGGVLPPTRKSQTRDLGIRTPPLPARVTLLLEDGRDQPWREVQPIVKPGQYVRAGEPVARAVGHLALPVHASISGHVSALFMHDEADAGGQHPPAVVIEADGASQHHWLPPLDWQGAAPDEIIQRIADAGIAGMGGGGFPAHLKVRAARQAGIDTLVVNAAECEPYLSADDQTLRQHTDRVLLGAAMVAHATGAASIVIGIEDDKPEAASAVRARLNELPCPARLEVIPTRYPSGGERQLIERLLGRRLTSDQLPVDAGVLCHNPGTLAAIHDAVALGKPMIERTLTLAGRALARPGNVTARLGTAIDYLLQDAGLDRARLSRVIEGGPMMGQAIESLDQPITQTTNGLIAADATELPTPPPARPCIRCGDCQPACPAGLAPQQLWWHAQAGEDHKAEANGLFDCIECGACDYVCPSHLPLANGFGEAKQRLRIARAESDRADQARHRFEARQAREQREAAEREARRQARRQAATRRGQQRDASSAKDSSADAKGTASVADVRGLRIAQAAAKAAARKAEKALERAAQQQQSADVLADLETQLDTARQHLAAADARLKAARQEETRP